MEIREQIHDIYGSLSFLLPELFLTGAILLIITLGLFYKQNQIFYSTTAAVIFLVSICIISIDLNESASLFGGMLKKESFSSYLKILMNAAGLFTCIMTLTKRQSEIWKVPEFFTLLLAVVLGGHLLAMGNHFVVIFLALELTSIGSYVLAGYAFNQAGSEGSLKYFLFGSVASAIMLYGFTILYGLTGTMDIFSREFVNQLVGNTSPLVLIAGIMSLAGFLYKMSTAPFHPWVPDVYEASPIPALAFLSAAPKLAGLGVLTKFIFAMNLFGQSPHDWQTFMAVICMLTLTIGNFSALAQNSPKRMMAYSSIAQSGFLLIGVVAFLPQGLQFMLFYASIYLLMNFLVFVYLGYFESRGITTFSGFTGIGKFYVWPSVFLIIGLISLTGLPPTAGFIAKLFIFSSLWDSYQLSGKVILLILLIVGLLNTVVSLFFYLKFPYYAFLKTGELTEKRKNRLRENLLGGILVLLILVLFFGPGLLMGWINTINFVF